MGEPWSPEWKQHELEILHSRWKDCDKCKLSETRQNVVFGSGNPDADIIFIGEAPGENEDNEGSPFVGKSGELLDVLLSSLEKHREDYYITNIVSCRPPKNRDPSADERKLCKPLLDSIIYLIDPLIIVPVGKYPLNTLVGGRDWGIERYHGSTFSSPHVSMRISGETNGVEVPGKFFPKNANKMSYRLEYEAMPIFHPAYILRVDSVDKKTMEFQDGGIAHQTFSDLERVFDRLEELKKEHARIERLLDRR